MIVTMHFGDGTFYEMDATSDDPDEAVAEICEYVRSHSWFEVRDPVTDKVLARDVLSQS